MADWFARDEPGYEAARRASVWNGRTPDRFPSHVVQAHTVADVVAAVRFAADRGLRIGVRSGGHSWAGSHLRDEALLLDVSALTALDLDPSARTAAVGPALRGAELDEAARRHGLFFPTGHCATVALGGYLLQGGFGWGSRLCGPACASVTAVEVVTANGEVARADARENPDLFWAARGSGPGFPGVVTRFELRLHERPGSIMSSTYVYPGACLDAVLTWANTIRAAPGPSLEVTVLVRRDLPGAGPGPALLVSGAALTGSEEDSRAALRILATCPAIDRAVVREEYAPTEIAELTAAGDDLLYPAGARYEADTMWTNASTEQLLGGMRTIVSELPEAPSHMMWVLWGEPQELPDMAFSMQAELYVALYGIGRDAGDDDRRAEWVTANMRALEPLAVGIRLAEENLARRPFAFMAPGHLRRLVDVRSRWDPAGRFVSYMRLPAGAPEPDGGGQSSRS